jgi:streptogramin lyase
LRTVARAAGPFNGPTNAAPGPDGDIFVSDGYRNARVHRFDSSGELRHSWGRPGTGPGEFHTPHSIWIHVDGRVFVADRDNERIQIFDDDGTYLTSWTDVQRPQDIFIDEAGLVFIGELSWQPGDYSHRRGRIPTFLPSRMSVFDPNGRLLLRWGGADPTEPGHFIAPHGIWVDDEGSLYVAEVTDTVAVRKGLAPPTAHTLQKFVRS